MPLIPAAAQWVYELNKKMIVLNPQHLACSLDSRAAGGDLALLGQDQLERLDGSQDVACGAYAHRSDPEDLALDRILTAGDDHALLLHTTPELVIRDARRDLHGGHSV